MRAVLPFLFAILGGGVEYLGGRFRDRRRSVVTNRGGVL